MNSISIPSGHLDDGALVRVLDGQPLPDDDTAHVDTCDDCSARIAVLRERSDRLRDAARYLDAVTPAPPGDLEDRVRHAAVERGDGAREAADGPAATPHTPHRSAGTRPWLRAAVLAGLLLAGALAAEPVRHWLADAVTELAVALGWSDAGDALTPGPGAEPDGPVVAVEITPAGPRLVFRLASPQDAGTVVVRFEERATARAEVFDDEGAASLVALPDGFRVLNTPSSTAGYRITVPRTLEAVVIRVGDRVRADVSADTTLVIQE